METWLIVGIISVIAIAMAVAYLYTYLVLAPRAAGRTGLTDPEKLATFRDSYTKTVAQLIGGVAVVATFSWTLLKDGQTLRQTANQSANQQFIDASRLAADQAVDLRAAGTYAFEKLVLAYPEYCPTVTSILTNQIMARTPGLNSYERMSRPPRVVGDIRAAVVVLGSIPLCGDRIKLAGGYMAGANFGGSKSFKNADLRNTKLYGAYLGWANFDQTEFHGAAMADRDSYGGEQLAWEKAKSGDSWQNDKYDFIVNFEYSTLRYAKFVSTSVGGASFKNADLFMTSFYNTNISRADFTRAKHLETSNLEEACYEGESEKPIGLSQKLLEKAKVRISCKGPDHNANR